jgi:hypothetical protein
MNGKSIVGILIGISLLAGGAYVYGGSRVPAGQPALQRLNSRNVASIAKEFDAAKDDIRVLMFFSPTCPVCLEGASSAGRMLKEFSGKPVRTFVVWEPVLWTDWSSPSTSALERIPDPRALQFWDKGRLLSHAMGERDGHGIVWDYVAVYRPGATWNDVAPPPALYHGGPVVEVTDEARAAIQSALTNVASRKSGQ